MTAAVLPDTGRRGQAVEFRGLRRSFSGVQALEDFSLAVQPGELVALLGPSGCGKTTALRILAGLDFADAGEVTVGGRDVSGVPAHRRDMGMVFQAYSLFPNLSARDNVAFGLRLRRVDAKSRRARAEKMLELVGLGEQATRYPHQMSGGQQQRVALARALAVEPTVLLLDEPLSALDAQVRASLRDEIRRLQLSVGITTLFVTHDQEEALSIADRVGVMRAGRLEQCAPPAEVYATPSTPFVAQFVGAMNRLPATTEADGIVVLGQRLAVPSQLRRPAGALVDALIRPESVRITAAAAGAYRVTARSFRGPVSRLQVADSTGQEIMADLPSVDGTALALDQPVDIVFTAPPVLLTDRGAVPVTPEEGA